MGVHISMVSLYLSTSGQLYSMGILIWHSGINYSDQWITKYVLHVDTGHKLFIIL